jgi:hypothetical protein
MKPARLTGTTKDPVKTHTVPMLLDFFGVTEELARPTAGTALTGQQRDRMVRSWLLYRRGRWRKRPRIPPQGANAMDRRAGRLYKRASRGETGK